MYFKRNVGHIEVQSPHCPYPAFAEVHINRCFRVAHFPKRLIPVCIGSGILQFDFNLSNSRSIIVGKVGCRHPVAYVLSFTLPGCGVVAQSEVEYLGVEIVTA